MAATAVHVEATSGFDNAQAYDAHRPTYPPEALQKLLDNVGLVGKKGAKVIDLAAGTGKFTEGLAAREEGFEIVAVEPLASMRGTLAAKGLKGVKVQEGVATSIDVEDGWADAVIIAQAFHWFATEEALQEIHRVLKPGGKLGMIWNVEEYNQPPNWPKTTKWEGALNRAIVSLKTDGANRFRNDVWWQVFDRQSQAAQPLFTTPLGKDSVHWTVWRGFKALLDRVTTLSQVSVLEGGEKEAFDREFEEIVARGGDAEWSDGDEVAFHGSTFLYWTTRI